MNVYKRMDLASGILREVTYQIDGVDMGRFSIYTHRIMDMSIFIELDVRRQNISRKMIREMLYRMQLEGAYDPAALVYIDTDASERFWDHVGLVPNPNVEDKRVPEYGYEKQITMESLSRYCE